ncbi:MAG: carbohydrate ABC transporter permease [Dethiobacter sp.]|nr:carbohydrate ABC transporter permease [Dethiobacter sp.]
MIGKILGKISIYLQAVLVFLIVAFPIYTLVLTSLQYERDIRTRQINFLPSYITLEHYKTVLEPGHIVPVMEAIINSFLVSIGAAALVICIAVPAAYGLSRNRLPGGKNILYALSSVYVIPVALFMIPLFVMFVGAGLNDTRFGLIILYTAFLTPFIIWVLKAFVEATPEEVEQAAKLDGCNHVQLFTRIYLPVMRPGISAAFLYAFVLSWVEFFTPLIFTAEVRILTVALGLYRGTIDIQIGQLAAAAVLAMLPVVLLTILFSRRITRVMTGAETK